MTNEHKDLPALPGPQFRHHGVAGKVDYFTANQMRAIQAESYDIGYSAALAARPEPAGAGVESVDNTAFMGRAIAAAVEAMDVGPGGEWNSFVAHIDAHVTAQVAKVEKAHHYALVRTDMEARQAAYAEMAADAQAAPQAQQPPRNFLPQNFLPQHFQQRVQPWMLECFGAEISADKIERNHRFLEEAVELVQAGGMTASEAHQLVDYTFNRPVGELSQEVGGVMVTLAALCLANDVNMHQCGEIELTRIWTKVDAIRAKQAAKPKHSPLPESAPQAQPVSDASESACKMCGDTPRITAQRLMLKERFANREPSTATADFDLPPACIEEPPTAPDAGARDANMVAAKLPNGALVQNVYEAYEAGLEEAAKVAENMNSHGEFIAGAIRALKTTPAKPAQDLVAAIVGLQHRRAYFTAEKTEEYRLGFGDAQTAAAAVAAAHLKQEE